VIGIALAPGWAWCALPELGTTERPTIKAGPFGSALKKDSYVSTGYRVYGQEQVIADDFTIGDYYIDVEKYRRLESCAVSPGDILVSLVGTYGKLSIVPDGIEPGIINPRLVRITLDRERVDPGYFAHFFRSPLAQFQLKAHAHGGTMDILNATNLKQLAVPLPALDEQRRIAAILDKADAIRRKRQEAIKLTEDFLRSAFLDMFGDPVTNPQGWASEPLGGLIESITAGWSASAEGRQARDGELGVLKVSAVTSGRFKPGSHKALPASLAASRQLVTPVKGDLLFSRANTRELVAATCLVEDDYPNLFLPDKLWRIRPKKSMLGTEYLRYLFGDPRFRWQVRRQATGTSGSMLNISQAKLRGVEAPVPPVERQRKFAELVWRSYAIRSGLESAADSSSELFNALVQRAFRGEL